MKTKTCCTCGMELPKTHEYFFRKVTKNTLSNGENKEYYYYRSDCKKCFAEKASVRRINKRCKELKCDIENYRNAWTNEIRERSTKNDCLKGLNLLQYEKNQIRKKIKLGYKFTSITQYNKDKDKRIKNGQLKRRKYNYGTTAKLTKVQIGAMAVKQIPKSRVALSLKIPVSDLPDDLYENLKLSILIKRELGMTHSSIRERNINKLKK